MRSPDEQIGKAIIWLGCGTVVLAAVVIGIIATIIKAWTA